MSNARRVEASCFRCGRSLQVRATRYSDQNGMVFCSDCRVLTNCTRCNREIEVSKSEYQKSGGEIYCEHCLVTFRCEVCGEEKYTTPETKSNNESLVCRDCKNSSRDAPTESRTITGPRQCVACGETHHDLVEFHEAPGEPVCHDCAPTVRSILIELNRGVISVVSKGIKYLMGMALYLFGAILISAYVVNQYNLSSWMFFVSVGILLLVGARYSQIFEPREIVDLGFATVAMTIAVLLWQGIGNLRFVTIFGSVAISGLIIHELSHKAIGLAFGKSAEFKAFYTLNLASIALVYFTGLLFALPGAVYHISFTDRATGIVAVAGPVSNILLAIGFLQISGTFPEIALVGVLVNTVLAGFNMLPIPPFDGSHVLRWNASVYLLVAAFIGAFGYQLFITLA